MKIGIDGSAFAFKLTGIGYYAFHLLNSLSSLKPDWEFVVLANSDMHAEFNRPNITIHKSSGILMGNRYYWKAFGQARAVKESGVDVLWAVTGTASFFVNCPVVLTVHDFVYLFAPDTMSKPARWFRHINQPWWIKRSHSVFTNSRAVSDEVLTLCGRSVDAVVRPAADMSFYPRDKVEIEQLTDKYSVTGSYNLIVGTLEPRKNVATFIIEYVKFQERHPDIQLPMLMLIGAKGWNDSELITVIEKAEREGVVRRLGYIASEELPVLYSGAELFFMPSRYEGFGMPILEARKCGCPVVCSDVPAMREAGGELALYHPPTAEGIVWALEEVYLRNNVPVTDNALDVDWSWDTGAAVIAGLLSNAFETV